MDKDWAGAFTYFKERHAQWYLNAAFKVTILPEILCSTIQKKISREIRLREAACNDKPMVSEQTSVAELGFDLASQVLVKPLNQYTTLAITLYWP